MTSITTKNGQQLARPLKVLVPLIQRDIKNAEHAGKMFQISAGAKLIEAKDQVKHGEWHDWLHENFHLSVNTATTWMAWHREENTSTRRFETQEDFLRSRNPSRKNLPRRKHREYHASVDRVLGGVNQKEMRDRAATAAKEHELERKLALQLIKIGYGVLATKLHPDKGGSHDAMRRLNKVAKRLREVHSTEGFLV